MLQALLHLAMLSEHTATLKAHGVPDYISGANIVKANRRPLTAPSMLESEAFHRALLGAVLPRNVSTAPPALKSPFPRCASPWRMRDLTLQAQLLSKSGQDSHRSLPCLIAASDGAHGPLQHTSLHLMW